MMNVFAGKSLKIFPIPSIVVLVSLVLAGCADPEMTHEEIVREDLLTIIEELGTPCGRVVEHEVRDELAYTVRCETGEEFRISVNPEGRVQVD